VGQQLRAPHLPAANVNKHMSAVRPGQQLQQPRPAGVHASHVLQQQLQQQQQQQRTQQLVAAQQAQQQQQKAAAAAAAGKPAGEGAAAKRQKTADAFPAAPDYAQSLYEVLYKAEKAGAGILKSAAAASAAAAATAAGASASVAAAAPAAATGLAADGPVTSIDEILRRGEAQAARAAAEPAGRGRVGADKAVDDDKLMSDSAIKRLLELQALNRVSVWVLSMQEAAGL
jgi:membrane protein involved in colicin uptake